MIKIALAGQPNCGKSTIFNMISGIYQHIANYPGVTVDKKTGKFDYKEEKIEVVDLPGTYSFSSYSLEERVAKDFILEEKPDLIVNVIDASNLKRNLYLTFQLLEVGIPVIIVLNMMDVAQRRGIEIDIHKVSEILNCPVIPASGAKGEGKEEILEAIVKYGKDSNYEEFKLNYEELEPFIAEIENIIVTPLEISKRWLSIKVLEGDSFIIEKLSIDNPDIKEVGENARDKFHELYDKDTDSFLATFRYDSSDVIFHKAIKEGKKGAITATDIADRFILNRWFAFPFLMFIMFAIYELSIVVGYKITDYTWPLLASLKNFVVDISPQPYLTDVPMITDFAIWMVNSGNALLNYLPIFFILFALIAILEDTGYMPRMAFILDRVFRKFGLHGQSTLPLVLGGAFVGGCAVPGVMATKGIADERARMATILSVPLMNCLAKVPFYTLLLGAFFATQMSLMMFFISTVTILMALIYAKVLTSTVLQTRETTPFVMELPPYHLPTVKGVLLRASERVWQYITKVVTIVLAIAIILFAMLEFPGVSEEKQQEFDIATTQILVDFDTKVKNNEYYQDVDTEDEVALLLNYYDEYKAKKMSAGENGDAIDQQFVQKNKELYKFVRPVGDKNAGKINRALRDLSKKRNAILREIKNEKIENSLLGIAGKSIEPFTQYAGFDWKINVSFLSSFAARESAVATLGSIYENNQADTKRAEETMSQNSGYTPLHATAMIIFMLLTPPCIATMIVVKMQTGSYKWMLFAIFFPIALGTTVAISVFQMGVLYSLDGVEAMGVFYMIVLAITLVLGFFPQKRINWSGGFRPKSDGVYSVYKRKNLQGEYND